MTRLVNAPADFASRALAGFASANQESVMPVYGGVVRAEQSPRGQVAIVMGGGSGHFPAFAGWVGAGFGHGAACGDIFASPSEAQIDSVARAADNGGGVLFAPINYAGDILHFGAAAERLRADGVDVRMVPITDDIASGGPDDTAARRGIAGSFIVLKIAGAAAESGASLDEVTRILSAANDATRSLGVAFSGCTLPGADAPLFVLPPGRMALGLGIHGEPGIAETELGTADEVADQLVDGLFGERAPEPGRPLAVLVNGLGSTKYDELFLVFERVRERLEDAGMSLLAPVVGEQVTSLDMAGLSVSLTYLDDELARFWTAAADVPSFARGAVAGRPRRLPPVEVTRTVRSPVVPGSPSSQAVAAWLAARFAVALRILEGAQERLGEIDAVAGDGDHGVGMVRGATAAAREAARVAAAGAGAGALLRAAGDAWSDVGGGTSGALWGAGLAAAGDAIGDETAPDAAAVARAARAYADAITTRGGAVAGDKTMMDAVLPFVGTLEREAAAGSDAVAAWRAAAEAAEVAASDTAGIVSRRGRSRIHGERSLGTPDAGATSFALLVAGIR